MYVAIDIGGTKTEIAFYQEKDLSSLTSTSVLPTSQSFEIGVKNLLEEIERKLNGIQLQGIGVSFAGVIGKNGEIMQATNLPDYKNQPLRKKLQTRFQTDVFIVQDSSCSAIAELVYGKIQNYSRVVHLIIGTGLGATFLQINKDASTISPIEACGMIVNASNGRNHEHNKTPGLLEAYVGGGNIQHFYKVDLSTIPDDHKIWEEVTNYLAIGINNLNCILKPEIVIIGGGIGVKRKNALKNVEKKVQQFKEFVYPPKVEFTKVEGNSSLIGALAMNFVNNIILNT